MPGKIAYLVIAHSQPGHLERLINRLYHPADHFFVLIDGKQPAGPFFRGLKHYPNVHFLTDRIPIYWVGIGTVEAELILFREALRQGPFVQYVLLSGADYPIKPLAYIRNFLLNETRNFIPVHGRVHPGGPSPFSERFTRYHFLNNDYLNPRGKYRNHRFFGRVRRFLEKYPIPRNVPGTRQIYQGPTWVSLTQPFVEYVLKTVAARPGIVSFYRHTYCPDEMFLPSLIKDSPFAETNYFDFERPMEGRNWLGLFYTDWHTPDVALPKILDATDLEPLRESHPHALFARKFDEKTSADLLNRIDEQLLV